MSYDLLLMRFRSEIEPPRSLDQIQAADLEQSPGIPMDLDRLAGELIAVVPHLERCGAGEELTLAAPGWGQIALSVQAASIKLPYWHDSEAARGVVARLWRVLAILRAEGRLHALDPQLGQVLDLDRDQGAVLREYLQGRAALLAALAPGEPGVIAVPTPQKRPWWQFWHSSLSGGSHHFD